MKKKVYKSSRMLNIEVEYTEKMKIERERIKLNKFSNITNKFLKNKFGSKDIRLYFYKHKNKLFLTSQSKLKNYTHIFKHESYFFHEDYWGDYVRIVSMIYAYDPSIMGNIQEEWKCDTCNNMFNPFEHVIIDKGHVFCRYACQSDFPYININQS